MSLPVTFHPQVRGEVAAAFRWYERQAPGLGSQFQAAIEELVARVALRPEAYGVIHRDIRRALARRFPYAAFFRVKPDRIEVLAIQHTSRDPHQWRARARE